MPQTQPNQNQQDTIKPHIAKMFDYGQSVHYKTLWKIEPAFWLGLENFLFFGAI